VSASRINKRYMDLVSLVFVFVVILSTAARAELYGFAPISNNSTISGQMAAQLSLEVTDYGSGQVLFTFYNDGPSSSIYDIPSPIESSITDVYFDDGALVTLAEIFDVDSVIPYPVYPGVDFEQFASPPDLPGGNTLLPPFEVSAGFLADSEKPIAANGVNPGEALGILFTFATGKTFDDVITGIELGFTNPIPEPDLSLRIALRIQSYGEDNEFSDGFILTPVPGAVVLGILGLGVAGIKLRKFA